ncbi:protein KRBA1 isoform X2 [Lathamus discolor]|uniref:protein KRBA1 isoform X2 n=1 Tax=Lathamus discolor TaxID=678569 RepID=UPI0032B806E1
MAASRQEEGWDPPVASPQAPVTFEDVAVLFSAEEWELLEEWQRELHREVTEGTSQLLASLGPPSSPALAALVRLVKEIPEFLFGGPKAEVEPGATTSGDTEWMGVNVTMEAPSESCPLRGLERCLQELAGTGSGPSAPPASSRYGPIERHQEEPGGHQPLCVRRSPGGAAWRGIVPMPWHGMALYHAARHGAERAPRHSMAWYRVQSMVRCGIAPHGTLQCGLAWHSTAQRGTAWRDRARCWFPASVVTVGRSRPDAVLGGSGTSGCPSGVSGRDVLRARQPCCALGCGEGSAMVSQVPPALALSVSRRPLASPGTGSCCPQAGDGAGCPVTASSISSASTTAGEAAPCDTGWNKGVCRSPMPMAGVTAPAVPPQSPAETQALGASSTATRRDPHRAAGTRPPATMGTATKRPLPEVGAASPVGSSTCPRGCTRASSPKKSDPGGSPAAPWQPLGEAQRPRAAVGRAHVSMAAEELGSVRRELRAMQSRQARLERGWVRGLPALTRGHRHRRRAARCLRSCCWVLDTRSRLPHGAGGASTISPLQTGLQPALAQPRLHGLLRFTDTAVLARAARTCPQPRSWAGAHLAIAPIACPHHAGPAMLPAGWPGECLPAMAKALRGCE